MRNFKRILKTAGIFLLAVAVISFGFMELYFRSQRDSFQDAVDRDRLAGTLDLLISGSSHAYRDYDPTVLDQILGTNSYNVSGALMTMQGRYEMLKRELERNPVKTVILDLTYNTMSRNRATEGTEGDLYVLARLGRLRDRIDFFFRAFSVTEYPGVWYKYFSEGVDTALELAEGKNAAGSDRRRGYLPTGPRTVELAENYSEVYHSKSNSLRVDPYNVKYLNLIRALCTQKGIRVILVTAPVSDIRLASYDGFQELYAYYQDMAADWGSDFYDFNLYRGKSELLPDSTHFYDDTHLNPQGAEVYSRLVAELLLDADAGIDVSDRFYATYQERDAAHGLG